MRRIAIVLVLLVIVALGFAAYLLTDPLTPLAQADQVILYSIDGNERLYLGSAHPEEEPNVEKLATYPVLGKLNVTNASMRQPIVDALKRGIAESDGSIAFCFNPRHAVRAIRNGEEVLYVICFECGQLNVHRGGQSRTIPITRSPQPLLNKLLTDANIPLAPGMTEDEK